VRILFIILLSCSSFSALAQNSEEKPKDKKEKDTSLVHFPNKAALWSLFPAAGQVYNEIGYRQHANKKNRAWWKVPIIYGGLGACSYFWYKNMKMTQLLKKEILWRRDNGDSLFYHYDFQSYSSESDLINGYTDFDPITGQPTTKLGFDEYARRRDLLLFGTIGVYGIQILEAYIDAHFVTFDVSQDLSMSIYPKMMAPRTPGVSLSFNFN